MTELTIDLEDSVFQKLEKYAAQAGKTLSRLVADIVAHEIEQSEALEALKLRTSQAPSREEFLAIMAKVPNAASLPGDEMPEASS